MNTPNLSIEAKVLAARWGINPTAIRAWMKARGFRSVVDLMRFSMNHAEAMDRALADFWEWTP